MPPNKDEIVLPPLKGDMADLWNRIRESLGSSDKTLLEHAVTTLAHLIEAEQPDTKGNKGNVILFRKGQEPQHLRLPVTHGLITPFTINRTQPH